MPIFMYQMADINTCYFVLNIQVCSSWSVCWKDSLNFIRLLRVVITPSVTSDVVERRKRLEAIGWISGYWKEWLCQLGGVKITTVRLAHDADLIAIGKTLNFNPNLNSLSRTPKGKEQTEDLRDKITHVVEQLKKT